MRKTKKAALAAETDDEERVERVHEVQTNEHCGWHTGRDQCAPVSRQSDSGTETQRTRLAPWSQTEYISPVITAWIDQLMGCRHRRKAKTDKSEKGKKGTEKKEGEGSPRREETSNKNLGRTVVTRQQQFQSLLNNYPSLQGQSGCAGQIFFFVCLFPVLFRTTIITEGKWKTLWSQVFRGRFVSPVLDTSHGKLSLKLKRPDVNNLFIKLREIITIIASLFFLFCLYNLKKVTRVGFNFC